MRDGARHVTGVRPAPAAVKVALLTGGKDPHYVGGLLRALTARGVDVALVCGSELTPHTTAAHIEFHNLVGSQDPSDGLLAKAWRVLTYYARLIRFAARTDARLFHVLWCRKFPVVERTVLSAYFKALRKRLVFTAHNIDDEARDGRRRTLRGRLSLRFLYRVADHVLVHTDSMKRELIEHFGVADARVTVVPLGINDVIPVSSESRAEARQQLGLGSEDKVLLFFGNIAPYKGVEDLVRALGVLVRDDPAFRLIIAGPVRDKSSEAYWHGVEQLSRELGVEKPVHKTIGYIPDEAVGRYFRASDVVILPYRRIYQSGV